MKKNKIIKISVCIHGPIDSIDKQKIIEVENNLWNKMNCYEKNQYCSNIALDMIEWEYNELK